MEVALISLLKHSVSAYSVHLPTPAGTFIEDACLWWANVVAQALIWWIYTPWGFTVLFRQVTHEPAKCVRLLPAHSYAAVGFNSGLITLFTFVLASQGFGKVQ